jgi:VanZ family protein
VAVTKRIREYWLPVLVWLFVIFFFSTDRFSSGNTSRILFPVLTFFFPRLSIQEFEIWHHVIRKCAHVMAYFLLSTLTYRCLKHERIDLVQARLTTMSFILVVAILDEVHQGMTAYRTPSPLDVGYDCLGAVWALLLITGYETRRLRAYPVL